MKVAIVGSRTFYDTDIIEEVIDNVIGWSNISLIISGGASGVDTIAKNLADLYGINIIIHRPDYEKYKDYPKYAPLARNELIVKDAEVVVAFTDGKSKGTQSSIEWGIKLGKRVIIHNYITKTTKKWKPGRKQRKLGQKKSFI